MPKIIRKVCNKEVVLERKSQVQQHIRTETHQYKLKSYSNGEKQLFLSECDNSQVTKKCNLQLTLVLIQVTKSFNLELTSAFNSADISLCKIEKAELKSFLNIMFHLNPYYENII